MTHLDDAALSAFLDGELAPEEADAARAHLALCLECESRRKSFAAASAAFRRSGVVEMPAGVAARAKADGTPRRRPLVLVLAGAVGSLIIVLCGGIVLKMFMPTLFNNIQQMITGAASQMGSGGK